VLIVGGANSAGFLDSAELFDPSTGTFTQLPDSGNTRLQTGRADAIAAPLPSGKVLIAGGYLPGGHWLQSAEIFDPSTNTFTALPASGNTELQTPRAGAVAADLPYGRVLIAGGINQNTQLRSAEVFDSATNTFTALPASGNTELQTARYGAVAAPLPGGTVLIAGGQNGTSAALQTAEVFNPSYNSFTQLPASGDTELQTPRNVASAAVLPDGRVLIAGGQDAGGVVLQSAEVFDPASGTFSAAPASGKTELQTPRQGAVAAPIPGGVLVAGGDNAAGVNLQSAELTAEASPPSCSNVSADTPVGGGQVTVALQCTESAGIAPSYQVVTPPAHGTLGPTDQGLGTVVYTPQAGYAGQDTFTYQATNLAGVSTVATATIMVRSASASLIASTSGPTALLTFKCQGASVGCAGQFKVTARVRVRGGDLVGMVARNHADKHKTRPVMIQESLGSGSYSIAAGSRETLRFTLNRAGKQLLSRFYRLPATFTFSATSGTVIPTQIVRFSYPRITALVPYNFRYYASFTEVLQLAVSGVPKGGAVTVTCRGRGCPFVRRTIRHERRPDLTRLFHGAHLSPGTTVEITITAPDAVGKVDIFEIQADAAPTLAKLCLPPGAQKPLRCAA
jgi:hypothetical protein